MRYVIIGGGIAGTTAAEELRKLDPDSSITIVSEEQHPIYSRVLLPHYLKDKIPRERVFLKKETWYEDKGIEWIRGLMVKRLDTTNTFVELSDARELEYDKLLIATGGSLRTLPSHVRGVSYLRTLDDADHLYQLLREQGGSCRGGIYGGGFIACEYLNLFEHYNIESCIAFRGDHFWSQILEKEAGELISKHLKTKNVKLVPNAEFKETVGIKELQAFKTSCGSHSCTLLGIGIGMDVDQSWLSGSGVETGTGVNCDEFLRSNVENVFVAGDVAEFYDVNAQRHRNVGNWMNALMQGRCVAKNMTGQETKFELVSSYATNALGLEIVFIGDTSREHADDISVEGSVDSGSVSQLFYRGERLVGAVLIGDTKQRTELTKQMQKE